MLKKIVDFHIKHKYYVRIKPLPKMYGCFVSFPINIIHNHPQTNITYIIDENGEFIELYHQENEQINNKVINTNKTNVRLLIFEDILLKTLARGISRHLIVIESDKNLFDLLQIKATKEDLVIEKELCKSFRKLLMGEKNDVSAKIEEDYKQVVECFEKGGL